MKVHWKKLFVKTAISLVAEVWLNYSGLDNLADYSEFLFENQVVVRVETFSYVA